MAWAIDVYDCNDTPDEQMGSYIPADSMRFIEIVMYFITSAIVSFLLMEITELQWVDPSQLDLDPFMMSCAVTTAVRMPCVTKSDSMRTLDGMFGRVFWTSYMADMLKDSR